MRSYSTSSCGALLVSCCVCMVFFSAACAAGYDDVLALSQGCSRILLQHHRVLCRSSRFIILLLLPLPRQLSQDPVRLRMPVQIADFSISMLGASLQTGRLPLQYTLAFDYHRLHFNTICRFSPVPSFPSFFSTSPSTATHQSLTLITADASCYPGISHLWVLIVAMVVCMVPSPMDAACVWSSFRCPTWCTPCSRANTCRIDVRRSSSCGLAVVRLRC